MSEHVAITRPAHLVGLAVEICTHSSVGWQGTVIGVDDGWLELDDHGDGRVLVNLALVETLRVLS